MINITDMSKCTGCSTCFSSCPMECISMNADKEGFLYPWIDEQKCIQCNQCMKICPIQITCKDSYVEGTKAYAAYAKNMDTIEKSSSGGVFSVIAETILEANGVVFGAAFDEDLNVYHTSIVSKEEMDLLKGSKYVQSDMKKSYSEAKKFLKQGRQVLFSGTPCQIQGLKSFLNREYDNLLCQDIVCHGVPSPKVWRKYLQYIEKKYGSRIVNVNFRDKTVSWQQYSLKFKLEDGREVLESVADNVYMRAFIYGMTMRPSCFNCNFKGVKRNSDITLGDFWGVESLCKEGSNERGTSLILIHSEKGQKIIELISNKLHLIETFLPQAIVYNQSAVKSAMKHPARAEFFERYMEENFEALVKELVPQKKSRSNIKIKFLIKIGLKKTYNYIEKLFGVIK